MQLTVGGQTAPLSLGTIAYVPPTLTGIDGIGADLSPTQGGLPVILTGQQFGPSLTVTGATYGALGGPLAFSAAGCRVSKPHVEITCATAPGSGRGLYWNVTVAGQTSPIYMGRNTSYALPVTGTFTGPGSSNAQTYGSEFVVSACVVRETGVSSSSER